MPTHRTPPDNQQDPIRLRNLLSLAKRRLAEDPAVPKELAAEVYGELAEAAAQLDLRNVGDGLALFASPGEAHVQVLDTPVRERVVVADTYEVRDVVADAARRDRYWTLVLSEQPSRLWSGDGMHLTEVTAHGFPYRYEAPAPPGDYGQSPSAQRDERHRQFFRDIATGLGQANAPDNRPVFVLGVERHLAFFAEQWPDPIAGTVTGNYDHAGPHELLRLLEPQLAGYASMQQVAALESLDAARGANRFAAGLAEVWQLADQGRGAHLVVEEHFHRGAWVHGNHLDPADPDADAADLSDQGRRRWLDDAVDDIVEAVARQGGKITFVPDESLPPQARIALTLRY